METGLIGPRWWWHKVIAIRLKWWDDTSEVLCYANSVEVIIGGAIVLVAVTMFVLWCYQRWAKHTVRLPDVWPD